MAIFQHLDRSIVYRMEPSPFSHDLALLQGAQETTDFWKPVVEEFSSEQPLKEGRILLCDWFVEGKDVETMARDFIQAVRTLGLEGLRVVACREAVPMVEVALRQAPRVIGKALLWSEDMPQGEALKQVIAAFAEP